MPQCLPTVRGCFSTGDSGSPGAPVAGLQEVPGDPYAFKIVLNQPYPQLRYLMAMHFTAPMAREAVEEYGEELARHPVGAGPYVLSEYLMKRRIVLTANPNRPLEYYPTEGDPDDEVQTVAARSTGQRSPRRHDSTRRSTGSRPMRTMTR